MRTVYVAGQAGQASYAPEGDCRVEGVALNCTNVDIAISTDPGFDINAFSFAEVTDKLIFLFSAGASESGYYPLGHWVLKGESIFFSADSAFALQLFLSFSAELSPRGDSELDKELARIEKRINECR